MERIHAPYVRLVEHPTQVVKADLEGTTRSSFLGGRDLPEYTTQRGRRLFCDQQRNRQVIFKAVCVVSSKGVIYLVLRAG